MSFPAYVKVCCDYRLYSSDSRRGSGTAQGAGLVRRHPAIDGGEDLASAALKPWVGDLAARARPKSRAPRRA